MTTSMTRLKFRSITKNFTAPDIQSGLILNVPHFAGTEFGKPCKRLKTNNNLRLAPPNRIDLQNPWRRQAEEAQQAFRLEPNHGPGTDPRPNQHRGTFGRPTGFSIRIKAAPRFRPNGNRNRETVSRSGRGQVTGSGLTRSQQANQPGKTSAAIGSKNRSGSPRRRSSVMNDPISSEQVSRAVQI